MENKELRIKNAVEKYGSAIIPLVQAIIEENEWMQDFIDSDDELTDFIHAIANLVPVYLHNHITGKRVNNLQFNHIANQLCFQYTTKIT